MSTRRDFLRSVGLGGAAGFLGATALTASGAQLSPSAKTTAFKPIKFGIIADIHRDLTPDVDARLEAFMKQVDVEKPDFIISLGDFAHAVPENESFRDRFASSNVPSYHVLGNHEMDRVSKNEAADFLKMPAPFYSFDIKGYHCVVLDPNFIYSGGKFLDYEKGNYFKFGGGVSYMSDDHCDWLEADLKKTNLPTFLFSHQSLLHDNGGIPNRAYIQRILETENERSGFTKIQGCFNGHHHQDYYRRMSDIHYFSLNSVSYYWHGQKIPGRYPEELTQKFRNLDNMAMYDDPLFSFVTINQDGGLSLKGRMSKWSVTPAPNEPSKSVRYGREMTPNITDRNVVLK